MRLIDRCLLAAVRWRLARRKPGTREYFSDELLHLVAGELVAKAREARAVEQAAAELELRVAAQEAFETISISVSEREVRYQ